MGARRIIRSQPWRFWIYVAVNFVVLILLMYLIADRTTRQSTTAPTGTLAVNSEVLDGIEPANEFVPVDRDISECISAIPKPGCGSDARGGWRQSLVLLAILVGLALIVWRIVVGARKAREAQLRRS